MPTWREKRAWRAEFKDLGINRVQEYEHRSIWHETPGKLPYARRWIWWQKLQPMLIGAAIAAFVAILLAFFKAA